MATTETIEVAKLFTWSEAKEVNTKNGRIMLRNAPADDKVWSLWKKPQRWTQRGVQSVLAKIAMASGKPAGGRNVAGPLCHQSR